MDLDEFETFQSILNKYFSKQIPASAGFHLCQISKTISLTDREKKIVNKAVPKRVYEFSAGRMCARKCLSILGVENFEILQGPYGEPIWPDGLTGSITHHSGMAFAVAMPLKQGYIGIDIVDLSERLSDPGVVLNDKELELEMETSENVGNIALLLFSLKESVIKILSPLRQEYIEFKDIEINFDKRLGTVKFRVESINIDLHWLCHGQYAITVAILKN